MFRGRCAYVERTCDRWFILSAKHGLLDPDEVVEPYDVALKDASTLQRRAWSDSVLDALQAKLGELKGVHVEIHAGSPYRDFGLVDGLRVQGAEVENPTQGLSQGGQLAFYKAASERVRLSP